MGNATETERTLSAEDRRSLMYAAHLCQLVATTLITPGPSSIWVDDDTCGLLSKFSQTAHDEIEQVLTGRRA